MTNFFRTIVRETIKHREETGLVRPDMIHLLREAQKGTLQYEEEANAADSGFAVRDEFEGAKNKDNKRAEITEEDIMAQAVIFFFAGYENVSLLLCTMALELASNTDIQEKLIQEVDDTWNSCKGKITYEALLKMKYLDMVVSETFRLWGGALIMNRQVVKPFTIEPELPGEKPLHLEVGTDITIPTFAIHRDPKYYPNPNKFDPERFSDENKHNIDPLSYLPFGAGPRHCIGNRFTLLQIKVIVFFILTRFEIVPVEKTSVPIVLSKSTVILENKGGYWLGLKPRVKLT